MGDFFVALLSAVLAVSSPGGARNAIPATSVNTNDPVAHEYQSVIDLDDQTMREVEKLADQPSLTNGGDVLPATVTLNQRVQLKLDAVKNAYEDFLRHHPDYAKAHLAYGSFLNETRDEDGAVEHWDKARQLEPNNPAAWNNLANYYGHRGPVTNAFAYYDKAIELDPNESVYYHNLAVTVYLFRRDAEEYYHLDESQVFDRSLALYREAMKRDPADFVLASDYAESFYGIKPPRWEDGLIAWDGALKSAHDEVEREGVYIHLARINWNLKRFPEAHRWLDQVTNSGYAVLKKRIARNIAASETATNKLSNP